MASIVSLALVSTTGAMARPRAHRSTAAGGAPRTVAMLTAMERDLRKRRNEILALSAATEARERRDRWTMTAVVLVAVGCVVAARKKRAFG